MAVVGWDGNFASVLLMQKFTLLNILTINKTKLAIKKAKEINEKQILPLTSSFP